MQARRDSCGNCFTTRMRLAHHKFENHKQIDKKSRSEANPSKKQIDKKPRFEADPAKRQMIHNEKLREVETLLEQEGDLCKCKSCGKTFDRRQKLRNHVEIHVKGLSYQCKHCSKLCPNRVSLQNHLQNTHRVAKEANMASKGNNFFSDYKKKVDREQKTNRTETVNKVSNSGPIHNIENSPDERFELHRQKLQEVDQLMIRGNGVWRCRHCDKTFKNKKHLRRHAETHVSGLSFPCDHCSEYFITRARLYRHNVRNHNETNNKKIQINDDRIFTKN